MACLIPFSLTALLPYGAVWYRSGWGVLTLPLFLLLDLMAALAVGLCLSALNTRYKGVGHTVSFLIQVGCTPYPVAYPVSLIPEQWRCLYTLNPMAGVIEGFRWTLLGKEAPAFGVMAVSAIVVLALLLTGTVFFRRMERTFADVIAEFDYFRHFGNISPCLG
jgi:lipopolysaccharide transport system permease protein